MPPLILSDAEVQQLQQTFSVQPHRQKDHRSAEA
jgi:hypothetical protein